MDVTHLPAVQVLVLVVEGEAGHLPLQVSKLWLHRHVGTEQEAAQNIPRQEEVKGQCASNSGCVHSTSLLFVYKR